MNFTLNLDDEAATLACGMRFAKSLKAGLVVHLHGDLGAGKTTFTRGVLRGLGYMGRVKSPTYTLVEPYETLLNYNFKCMLYHFDLYRFTSEDEWEAAGFREYFNAQTVCMIEWPEKAKQVLPQADIDVQFSLYNAGRQVRFSAGTTLGNQCLENF